MGSVVILKSVTPSEQGDQLGLEQGDIIETINGVGVYVNAEFFAEVNKAKESGAAHYELIASKINGKRLKCDVDSSLPLGVEIRESDEEAVAEIRASAIIVTTSPTVANKKIEKELGIVSAEVAYGMHVFKDLFKSVRDIVGGRAKAVETTLQDARKQAVADLKVEAYAIGAQAVVSVDFEMASMGNDNMIVITAYGTAVKISG